MTRGTVIAAGVVLLAAEQVPLSANLAALCRRQHVAKTKRRRRYRRLPDGRYHWIGPHDRHYLVDDTGTHPAT